MGRRRLRDISYAASARTRGGRAMIRALEAAGGRGRLIRRARDYEAEVAAGQDFWSVMMERFGLRLEIARGRLADIPATGPLIVAANHPFGILDGLVLGHLLALRRDRFRILANSVFRRAAVLDEVILPVDFSEAAGSARANVVARRAAEAHLSAGGALGVFPGGTVSTSARPFSRPLDPAWRAFTGRLALRSGATLVPIHFGGHNSRLFQLASHVHQTLRLGLLIGEFGGRVDRPVQVAIGAPAKATTLDRTGDARAVSSALRQASYALGAIPPEVGYGRDFSEAAARC